MCVCKLKKVYSKYSKKLKENVYYEKNLCMKLKKKSCTKISLF